MCLPVSHGLLQIASEAKATAFRYYNDNLLLESLNSKLKSFYYKPCGYTW